MIEEKWEKPQTPPKPGEAPVSRHKLRHALILLWCCTYITRNIVRLRAFYAPIRFCRYCTKMRGKVCEYCQIRFLQYYVKYLNLFNSCMNECA